MGDVLKMSMISAVGLGRTMDDAGCEMEEHATDFARMRFITFASE
jgi:hypothetical protein